MIRRADGDGWLLLTQPDHAALSGMFAERWGSPGGDFALGDPQEPVLLAAREHDIGWKEWEVAPTVDPATGRPRHFLEMPVPEILPIWSRGPRLAAELDPYAGILVSLHATRIFRPRYIGGRDPAEDRAELRRFLEEQEALRSTLRPRVNVADAVVTAHSALVGVWDRLSLLLCCGPIPAAVLEGVPARGGTLDVRILPQGERAAALDPYPFRGGPVVAAVAARRLPARPFPSTEAFRAARRAAPTEHLEFTLRPA